MRHHDYLVVLDRFGLESVQVLAGQARVVDERVQEAQRDQSVHLVVVLHAQQLKERLEHNP